jgi:two-component system response regulator FlrC
LKLLVVEDDDALRDALLLTLEAAGHQVVGVADGPAALNFLGHDDVSMVISDLRMAPMDGLKLLGEIRSRKPGLPVLLMTAFGDVDKAVAAMRGGACDFMLKPFEPRELLAQVTRYAVAPSAEGVIAEDVRTREVLLLASRVARSDVTVMLTGESGTGKEVFARYVHDQSTRNKGPFIAINCAAIPDSLLEATLFGYEKGAFTGAQTAQAGKFEQANGGTLLLDEISEMPLGLQAKLLRVLQQREVDRVGGKKPIPLDIRVIATSNRDMSEFVRKGAFREDLFYRLNVFPLHIPSLAERRDDLVPLAQHFLGLYGQGGSNGNNRRPALSAAAAAKIAAYHWPGNVRELENVIQRALILASGDTVEAEHLLLSGKTSVENAAAVAPTALSVAANTVDNEIKPAPTVRDMERQHILETLQKVGGSRRQATELLGISERTLRYKLKQYRDEGLL